MSERTLAQAIRNAERLRAELPHLIQPTNSDRDMVRLADELYRQRAEVERLRDLLAPAAYWLRAFDCGDTLTFEGQEAVSNLIESIEIAARTVPSPGDGK